MPALSLRRQSAAPRSRSVSRSSFAARAQRAVAATAGLGLAISKTIVERHGGSIGVLSEEGRGATLWFRVPLAGPVPRGIRDAYNRLDGGP